MFAPPYFARAFFSGAYFPPLAVQATQTNRFGRITVIVDGRGPRVDDEDDALRQKPVTAAMLIGERIKVRAQRDAADEDDVLLLLM